MILCEFNLYTCRPFGALVVVASRFYKPAAPLGLRCVEFHDSQQVVHSTQRSSEATNSKLARLHKGFGPKMRIAGPNGLGLAPGIVENQV